MLQNTTLWSTKRKLIRLLCFQFRKKHSRKNDYGFFGGFTKQNTTDLSFFAILHNNSMLYPEFKSPGLRFFAYCICIIMWHSHLNDVEIPETKSFIPKGYELGATLSQPNRSMSYSHVSCKNRSRLPCTDPVNFRLHQLQTRGIVQVFERHRPC